MAFQGHVKIAANVFQFEIVLIALSRSKKELMGFI